ncbi:hypothetical protein F751_4305 [Auxenochlorella protothecoides]|uniref:Uncharacterized protein n=1 Tax=Auxenochlorella protothecoides TaxID=3075 RepID=A0A087SSX6_AUXPR|nr:hypothetical protein F751_4305 [Auxenochlorella protothecoides]KFM28830.1 hypothetical protein F751_4305 [Auxenochlorella protothecoides]
MNATGESSGPRSARMWVLATNPSTPQPVDVGFHHVGLPSPLLSISVLEMYATL